ncbi:hypothetical protein [Gracilimonas sp.]|uniref:hypothetical protein n=1 Tax=Gracilimonas sp. TaxID=1974203 RepID=UPI0028727330|nr:hypothetical protein [Gracilimonas sp.]
MRHLKIATYIISLIILTACQGQNQNDFQPEDAPLINEITFSDSFSGKSANSSFFNPNQSDQNSYNIVLKEDFINSKDQWKNIMKEVQPHIDIINTIYFDDNKSLQQKDDEISELLNEDEITSYQKSILEQVAACRMLPLLIKSDEKFYKEASDYAELLLKNQNSTFDLQINTLDHLKNYWSEDRIATAKQELLETAKSQLSESESYLAYQSKSKQELEKLSVTYNQIEKKALQLEEVINEIEKL